MALGNYIDKKVIAGFCKEHSEIELEKDQCCYGDYSRKLMGECLLLFE